MELTALFSTFANNLLPILLIGAAGYFLGRILNVDARMVGRLIFYFFTPVLIFDLLVHTALSWTQIGLTILFSLGMAAVIGLAAYLLGRGLRLERPVLAAIVLTTMFGNAGNYGLPLVSFAFGQDALAFASVFFVANAILFNSVGVLIASLGRLNWKQAALGLLRVPTLYAVLLALPLNRLGVVLPLPVERTVSLAADAAIPLMLVLIGLELQRARNGQDRRAMSLITGLRLVVAPLVALLFVGLAGFSGAARQAVVTESSMPVAVSATVLAGEYDLDSSLVTGAIVLTTLLSPLTLTPLLVFLGS